MNGSPPESSPGLSRSAWTPTATYDKIVGLELDDHGRWLHRQAPCGGQAAGKSPVDRGKQGTKPSLLTDADGIPLGCVSAPANRHDSVFLRLTLEHLGRFETRFGPDFHNF